MTHDLDIPLDRITYRDGQLLTALDLRHDKERDERLRRLHIRHLHETWGIALGLTVHHANMDGTAVVVAPGYAIDDAGHDLLLAEGIHLPVPNAAAPEAFVLTVRVQEDTACCDRSDLAGLCLEGGLHLRYERPLFAWRRSAEVCFGPEVPLVQVVVAQNALQGSLDFRVRRHARPFVRPHMGWGTTEAGRTGWQQWAEPGYDNLGLEVQVDTSEAGFLHTPYYFALLRGDLSALEGHTLGLFPSNVWPAGTEPTFWLDGCSFITNATPQGFTYRLLRAQHLPFGTTLAPSDAEQRRWIIAWLGTEPVTGGEPQLDLARVFALSGVAIPGLLWSILGTSEAQP